MQGDSTKRRALTRNVMVAGSACRSKMRLDEAKAGIKVFNGKESQRNRSNAGEEGIRGYRRLKRNQSDSVALERRKRTNLVASHKEEENAVQLQKSHSDLSYSVKTSTVNSLELKEKQPVLLICDGTGVGEDKEEVVEEEEVEDKMKSFVDKEMDKAEEEPKSVQEEEIPVTPEDEKKHQKLESMSSLNVVEKQQLLLIDPPILPQFEREEDDEAEMSESSSIKNSRMQSIENLVRKEQILLIDQRAMNPDPAAVLPYLGYVSSSVEMDEQMFEITSSRMQSIENLVMWRDVSRSALVFGFGTFVLLSPSYAKDINFSIISVTSYAGLFYLAFVFLCKSFLHRGEKMQYDSVDEEHVVEEEDAIWLLKTLLPYINELLLKLKILFSGDPATTFKLAGLLFVMARCGSSITIWSLVKLIFFGVFTVPKVCSSYSTQLAKLGRFWLDRIRDGWESCTHKKAVATAIFALIWNISSTSARIWAFFMLAVAVKLYQQCAADDSFSGHEEEEEGQEDSMAAEGNDGEKEVGQVEMS
ncbi:hypothetical protein Cni_G22283 [Canna indica]|uniref:Reticulon-like protein n=1 Tax=Canna indica TaxID=4628 RepID=A0AAQ3QL23_9LILI|nr:hypothetical protein Cni_G22283 [Canna indica]